MTHNHGHHVSSSPSPFATCTATTTTATALERLDALCIGDGEQSDYHSMASSLAHTTKGGENLLAKPNESDSDEVVAALTADSNIDDTTVDMDMTA
jgi:hypothetical protein